MEILKNNLNKYINVLIKNITNLSYNIIDMDDKYKVVFMLLDNNEQKFGFYIKKDLDQKEILLNMIDVFHYIYNDILHYNISDYNKKYILIKKELDKIKI